MKNEDTLRFGPIGKNAVHLCVDMQRLFADETDWKTPWMNRVVPNVVRLVEGHAAETVFTRFIPAQKPGEGHGTWARYYECWASMTIEKLGPEMIELVPELARFVPPGELFDKRFFSPWVDGDLEERLRARGADTLIISGGETDVCVLGTVLGGIDRGYRMIIVTDALCSSSDETHDAMLSVYRRRYGQQVETVPTDIVVENW